MFDRALLTDWDLGTSDLVYIAFVIFQILQLWLIELDIPKSANPAHLGLQQGPSTCPNYLNDFKCYLKTSLSFSMDGCIQDNKQLWLQFFFFWRGRSSNSNLDHIWSRIQRWNFVSLSVAGICYWQRASVEWSYEAEAFCRNSRACVGAMCLSAVYMQSADLWGNMSIHTAVY